MATHAGASLIMAEQNDRGRNQGLHGQGRMVRITATKGKLAATFGVDIKRMSYFFKDRDVVLPMFARTAPR
jgi:hypothetical protein